VSKRRGNGEGSITRHPKRELWMGRYTVETPAGMKRRTVYGKTRAECLRLFASYAKVRMVQDPGWLEPLRGKDLACWCPVGEACHADLLLRLANDLHSTLNGQLPHAILKILFQ
jgi:hypothetical protein